MIFSIKNKTLKILFNLGFYLSFFIILHFTVGRYIIGRLSDQRSILNRVEKELERMEALIKDNPDPQEKIIQLKGKILELDQKASSENNIPKVIQQLTKKSSELNIEINSIRPLSQVNFQQETLPRGVAKAYIELVAILSYKDLGQYIKGLKDLSTVFTIEGLTIERLVDKDERNLNSRDIKAQKVMATLLITSYTVGK